MAEAVTVDWHPLAVTDAVIGGHSACWQRRLSGARSCRTTLPGHRLSLDAGVPRNNRSAIPISRRNTLVWLCSSPLSKTGMILLHQRRCRIVNISFSRSHHQQQLWACPEVREDARISSGFSKTAISQYSRMFFIIAAISRRDQTADLVLHSREIAHYCQANHCLGTVQRYPLNGPISPRVTPGKVAKFDKQFYRRRDTSSPTAAESLGDRLAIITSPPGIGKVLFTCKI